MRGKAAVEGARPGDKQTDRRKEEGRGHEGRHPPALWGETIHQPPQIESLSPRAPTAATSAPSIPWTAKRGRAGGSRGEAAPPARAPPELPRLRAALGGRIPGLGAEVGSECPPPGARPRANGQASGVRSAVSFVLICLGCFLLNR